MYPIRFVTFRYRQAVCPIGTYCEGGLSHPCPAGTYGALPGLFSRVCSSSCPAGRYCPEGTSSTAFETAEEVGIPCPAGRFGVEGMGDAGCTGPCRVGYFCFEGSTSATENECGSPFVFCPEGTGAPVNVTTGWFATGGRELTRTGQSMCVAAVEPNGDGRRTPPSGISIAERCPQYTVGWNVTAVA